MINRIGEMQIALGNAASEKYRQNPLINKMIADTYKHTSNSLMTQFNPQAALATADSVSGRRVDEAQIRSLDAAGRASDAQARATATKEPQGLRSAYDAGGAGGLDEFMNGTDNGISLWESVRARFDAEVKEEFFRNWRKKNKNVTVNAKPKMQADFDKNQDRLNRLAQWKWVRSTLGEEIAKEFQKENPGYGPDKVGSIEFAVKGAVSPKAAKQKAEKFAGIANDRYVEWMGEQDPETTSMEDGIDFIMNKWLPTALAGELDSDVEVHGEYIADNLTAGQTKATAAYRALIRTKVGDHLKANAGTGKGGAKLAKHQRVSKTKAKGPGGRRATALGSLARGLFNEEEYPEEAPALPSEPEI
jgi:hypothetical protein